MSGPITITAARVLSGVLTLEYSSTETVYGLQLFNKDMGFPVSGSIACVQGTGLFVRAFNVYPNTTNKFTLRSSGVDKSQEIQFTQDGAAQIFGTQTNILAYIASLPPPVTVNGMKVVGGKTYYEVAIAEPSNGLSIVNANTNVVIISGIGFSSPQTLFNYLNTGLADGTYKFRNTSSSTDVSLPFTIASGTSGSTTNIDTFIAAQPVTPSLTVHGLYYANNKNYIYYSSSSEISNAILYNADNTQIGPQFTLPQGTNQVFDFTMYGTLLSGLLQFRTGSGFNSVIQGTIYVHYKQTNNVWITFGGDYEYIITNKSLTPISYPVQILAAKASSGKVYIQYTSQNAYSNVSFTSIQTGLVLPSKNLTAGSSLIVEISPASFVNGESYYAVTNMTNTIVAAPFLITSQSYGNTAAIDTYIGGSSGSSSGSGSGSTPTPAPSSNLIRSHAAVTNSRLAVEEQKTSTIIFAAGFNSTGAYVPSSTTPYISSAIHVKGAVEIVANKLYDIETNFAETAYVDQKIADLIGSAPAILDTLGEIATSLADNPNLSASLVSTIAAETTRATAAEESISSALAAETERAELAEAGLSSLIADETARAISEEQMLSTIIAGEKATARAEEAQLSTLIAAETARAIAYEEYLSVNIHTEIARAMAEDTTVNSALAQEIQRATDAETVLSTLIVNERIRATGEEQALSTMLATEKSRAMLAEMTLSSALVDETARATAAESGLSTLIADEKARAILAEQGISTALVAETARAVASEQSISSALVSEVARATAAEQSISSALVAETDRAVAAELVLRTDLSGEIVRATAAELVLTNDLAAEVSRATAAELVLRTDLSGEIARATAAEQAISSTVSTIQVDYLKRDGTLKMTGALDMSGSKIINVNQTPTALGDAVSLGYYNAQNTIRYTNSHRQITLSTISQSARVTPYNLDSFPVSTGTIYRVGSVGASGNGCAVHSILSTFSQSLTANAVDTLTTFILDNAGALSLPQTFNISTILDLSGNMDGSGSTVGNPYDLTQSGNDLKTKYPGYTYYRVPLTSRPRYYTGLFHNLGYTTTLRLDPGDMFFPSGNNYFLNRYISPINASVGGTITVDYYLRPVNNTLTMNFYTQVTSTGTVVFNFRRILNLRNNDLLIKNPTGLQWDVIDTNDPVVTGTPGRIKTFNHTDYGDIMVDIHPDYVGQSTITTLGTVTTGTWNAGTIQPNRGGTGYTSYAKGDMLYGDGVSTIKVPIGSSNQVLKVEGGVPVWKTNDAINVPMTTEINGSASVQGTLENLSTSIAAEASRAIAKETELSTIIVEQISSVIAAAPQALDTLKEIAEALGNDPNLSATLVNQINTEKDRALLAEAGLSSLIASETSRALSAESGLSTLIASGGAALADEIARATAAEAGLSSLIADTKADLSTEVARAEAAESGLSTLIADETARALAAELVLTNDLAAEVARAELAEAGLSTLIADETARALAAELVLTNDLAAEVSRAELAEAGLSTLIADEKARAEAAELVLTNDLAAEVSRAEAAEAGLSSLIATEKARAEAAELVLTNDLAAEVARAELAEAGLSTLIADETARALSAENTLAGNLSTEVSRAQAAEAGLSSLIAVETARAVAAENGLDGRLDTVESQLTTGTQGQVLKYVSGVATFATNDTAGVSLSSTTNFPSITTLQAALDYLFNFTQTRKVIQHVVTSSTEYSSPTVPNVNFGSGKVHFINYNAANLNIYLPPTSTPHVDGTVYRIVHNGNHGDNNYTIKYYNSATSTTVDIFELAPRDTISFIWDADTSSYLFGVGL